MVRHIVGATSLSETMTADRCLIPWAQFVKSESNAIMFINNESANDVWKMAAILSRIQFVKRGRKETAYNSH